MLDSMHTAVLCGCCTALALRIAESIIPMKRFQKQIRLLFSMLMLVVLLKPLTSLEFSVSEWIPAETEQTMQEIAALAESAREEAVADSIHHALNQALTEHHVPCEVKDVIMHISDEGSIVIDEIRISGNLLTGAVYLHDWLGDAFSVTQWEEEKTLD